MAGSVHTLGYAFVMQGAGKSFMLLAVPAFGVTYARVKLAGFKRFNTSDKWIWATSSAKE
jgi:hypothetical protein